MYRKEVNEQSPLRILEKSIHGGLGVGNLGVVMARAGVGKTACLVQIGLDDLMREKAVLHVSLEHTVEHVMSWYDALFHDLVLRKDLDDVETAHDVLQKNRVIQSFADHDLWPDRLEQAANTFREHMNFNPAAILVDGYPWELHTEAENAATLGAFKAYAKVIGAELWMTAQTHRVDSDDHPTEICSPCADYENLIDVALFLEPLGQDISLRLLKDHGESVVPDTHLLLHPDTLSITEEGETREPIKLPTGAFTLLSGGARGAEAEFGACAEKWGLMELNFSFEGRKIERTRGVVRLTDEELKQGAVSPVYMRAHLHREFPETPTFQRMLQTIWHQVNSASEVFVIGRLLDDKTIKGGTGWAAELGRHWGKRVYVFDQEKKAWFTWDNDDWARLDESPRIVARRFTGSGTRNLSDSGRTAIRELFEHSFGPTA